MPLGVVFALVCSSRLYTIRKPKSGFESITPILLIFCALGFIVYSLRIDILSIVHAAAMKRDSARVVPPHFNADALAGLVTFGPEDSPERPVDGKWLAQYVNDGLALLRENTLPGDSVISLDYINPFSFALQRPPNEGGIVWLTFGDPYPDLGRPDPSMFRFKPDPSKFLGTAAVVMIPKWPTATGRDFEGTMRTYGTYLQEHFDKAAESKLWILEKRNTIP
jgi:hypothetical protein